jgi:hypothetical protein
MKNLSILIIAIIAMGCAEQKNVPENFDYGTTTDGKYINTYFDLVINFNPDWVVQEQGIIEKDMEKGGEIVYAEDEEIKTKIKASLVNSANLLTLFKYEIGAQVPFNPSLALIAENTNNFPGLKSGVDYLNNVKELLEQTQMEYSFDKDLEEKKLGDSIFFIMHLNLNYMGRTISQDYVTTVLNGFALTMVVSYSTEEEKAEIYQIINNIEI